MALWFSVIFQILAIKLHYLKKKSNLTGLFGFFFLSIQQQNKTTLKTLLAAQ